MASNRTKINESDPYVLCFNHVDTDEFFAKFNNKRYIFKPVGTNQCQALEPEANEIRHKSKYF